MARQSNPSDFVKVVDTLKHGALNVTNIAKQIGKKWQATNRILTSMEFNHDQKLTEDDDGLISIYTG